MVRINIESNLFTRKRWLDLVLKTKDCDKALGCLVRSFMVAQDFWFPNKKRIPRSVWEREDLNDAIIEVGLANENDDGVYINGSEEAFAWLFQRKEAGIQSGKSRQKKKPQKPKRTNVNDRSTTVERPSTLVERPRTSSSLSSSSSSSSSFSDSSICKDTPYLYTRDDISRNKKGSDSKVNLLISRYCENWKSRYGSNPPIVGKDAGIAKRLSKTLSKENIKFLIDAYFQMPDPWLVKKKHPLELFESKLKEIWVFAKSGKFVTQTEVRNMDKAIGAVSQLDRIKRGEL